jgi:protein-S-isoprenylcysteine O-methyltransferase Ste14
VRTVIGRTAQSNVWRRTPVPGEHVAGIVVGLLGQLWQRSRLPRGIRPVGPLLVLAGVAAIVKAVQERGGDDVDLPARLATTGLHGLTRNPMYMAWSALHIGLGLALRSPWVIATWPPSVMAVHRSVLREEAWLSDRFGRDYATYRDRVPRYLGIRHR